VLDRMLLMITVIMSSKDKLILEIIKFMVKHVWGTIQLDSILAKLLVELPFSFVP